MISSLGNCIKFGIVATLSDMYVSNTLSFLSVLCQVCRSCSVSARVVTLHTFCFVSGRISWSPFCNCQYLSVLLQIHLCRFTDIFTFNGHTWPLSLHFLTPGSGWTLRNNGTFLKNRIIAILFTRFQASNPQTVSPSWTSIEKLKRLTCWIWNYGCSDFGKLKTHWCILINLLFI